MTHPSTINGSLYINIYSKRDGLTDLMRAFRVFYALEHETGSGFYSDGRYNSAKLINPVEAPDTSVIQCRLADEGETLSVWRALRDSLNELLSAQLDEEHVWGYSLYYATNTRGKDPTALSQEELDGLLSEVTSLSGDQTSRFYAGPDPLAGGYLWLCQMPSTMRGKSAARVYLGLAAGDEQEESMLRSGLSGEFSFLFMLDLIATKILFTTLQLQHNQAPHDLTRGAQEASLSRVGQAFKRLLSVFQAQPLVEQAQNLKPVSLKQSLESTIDNLNDESSALLGNIKSPNASRQLQDLSGHYSKLNKALIVIETIEARLEIYQMNFEERKDWQHSIYHWYFNLVKRRRQEFRNYIKRSHRALSTAQAASQNLQTYIEKRENEQQGFLQNILAVFGIILALTQFIDKSVTLSVLQHFGLAQSCTVNPVDSSATSLFRWSLDYYYCTAQSPGALELAGAQFLIIATVFIPSFVVFWIIRVVVQRFRSKR